MGQRGRTRKRTRGEKLKRGACRKGLGKWQGRGTWGGGGGAMKESWERENYNAEDCGFESCLRQLFFFSGKKEELSSGVVACICFVSITDYS